MKTCTVFAASAVVAMVSIDSAMGMASYLKQLPNGDLFDKALGHKDSGYTDFGNAFSKAGAKWSADFCKQTFPGTTMTNGAAFGDPCCTWTAGGKADKTVNAFTDKPTTATTCDSAAAPSEAPAATTAAPAATDAPAATPAPAGDSPATPPAPAVTPAPTGKPSGKTPNLRPGKCGVKADKKDKKKGYKKESKSLEDEGGDDSEDTIPDDDNEEGGDDNNDD